MDRGSFRSVFLRAGLLLLVLLLFTPDCEAARRIRKHKKKFGCRIPQEPLHGRFEFNSRLREIEYICEEGYFLYGMKGETTRTCKAYMTSRRKVVHKWAGKHGDCIRLRRRITTCPDLYAPRNGSVTVSSRKVGGKAYYRCESGYILEGSNTLTCEAGYKWSGQIPICSGRKTAKDFAKALEDKFIDRFKASTSNSASGAQGKLSVGKSGLEVVFAMDVSSSIGPKSLKTAKKFMRLIVDTFGVSNETSGGKNGTRFALFTFTDTPTLVFNLNDKEARSKKAVNKKIKGIQHAGGGTAFDKTLANIMLEVGVSVITRENNARTYGSNKAIFFITDSEATADDENEEDLMIRSTNIKRAGFEIFVIGVGKNINRNVLAKIASEPYVEHVFLLNNFKKLKDVTDIISEKNIDYEQCGVSGDTAVEQNKVFSNKGAWPWLGWINVADETQPRTCGGVLLCERWFLTVAHCVSNSNATGHPIPVPVKKMDVFLGDHRLYKGDNTEAMVKPKAIHIHPSYIDTPNEQFVRPYDIALLDFGGKRKNIEKLDKFVRPICFPTNGSTVYDSSDTMMKMFKESGDSNSGGYTAGWGHSSLITQTIRDRTWSEPSTWGDGKLNRADGLLESKITLNRPWGKLKQFQKNVLPDKKCQKRYNNLDQHMFFCVGRQDEANEHCRCDIGGPYMAEMTMRQYTVLGLALDTTDCTKPNKFSIFLNLLHPEISSWVGNYLGKCNRVKSKYAQKAKKA